MKDITFERILSIIFYFSFFNAAIFTFFCFWSFVFGSFVVEDFTLRSVWPFITELISNTYGTLWKLLTFQANWLDSNILMVIFACFYYLSFIVIIFYPYEE